MRSQSPLLLMPRECQLFVAPCLVVNATSVVVVLGGLRPPPAAAPADDDDDAILAVAVAAILAVAITVCLLCFFNGIMSILPHACTAVVVYISFFWCTGLMQKCTMIETRMYCTEA